MAHEQRPSIDDDKTIRGKDGSQLSNRAQLARSGACSKGEETLFSSRRTLGDSRNGTTDGTPETGAKGEQESHGLTKKRAKRQNTHERAVARGYVPPTSKPCSKCGEVKPLDHFYVYLRCRDGRSSQCKKCYALSGKGSTKAYIARLRKQVLEAYGHQCACCGETEEKFLAVNHIFNDGAEHRRTIASNKSGTRFYVWLRQRGFPKDRYQLLCHNCNCAKGYYGSCPHADRRSLAA